MIRRCHATHFLREARRAGVNIDEEVQNLVKDALAVKTRSSYSSAEKLYQAVLRGDSTESTRRTPIYPCTGYALARFIWVMSSVSYPHSTIRSYVSAIKTLNTEAGYVLKKADLAVVSRALKGAQRRQSRCRLRRFRPKRAKPLSKTDLGDIMRAGLSPEERTLSVAILLATFVLLRADECLDLNMSDITFVTKHRVDVAKVRIRRGKTDQMGSGATRRVGCALLGTTRPCAEPSCATHRLYDYMCDKFRDGGVVNPASTPVFGDCSGARLKYKSFLSGTRLLVRKYTGVSDWSAVGTHSMRRTGARWMWAAKIPRFNRLAYGRWSIKDSSLESHYLSGVARSQEYKYASAMLNGAYDGC